MSREIKTDDRTLDITRKYRLTKKGVIRNMFSHIKERGEKYGRIVEFNSNQFVCWCNDNQQFSELYDAWVIAGFPKNMKPSVDRKDPLIGYLYSNIQVVTYQDNRDKGDVEKEILWGTAIIQYDLSGKEVNRFPSLKEAVRILGLHQGNLSSVLNGKRRKTGGFRFKYDASVKSGHPSKRNIYEHPNPLTP